MAKRKARRRGRGGRHRLEGVAREPNGRPSRRVIHVGQRREMNEREVKRVGVEARMRMTGLSEELAGLNHAGMPNAGTVHGVMRLRGELTAAQWDAAEWWVGVRSAYLRAIDAPGRKTTERGEGAAFDEAVMAEWCRATVARWAEVNVCLTEASAGLRRPLTAALDVILVRNQPMPHMEDDLRAALDALHRRFLSR